MLSLSIIHGNMERNVLHYPSLSPTSKNSVTIINKTWEWGGNELHYPSLSPISETVSPLSIIHRNVGGYLHTCTNIDVVLMKVNFGHPWDSNYFYCQNILAAMHGDTYL